MTSPYDTLTEPLADPTVLGRAGELQRSRHAAQRYAELAAVADLRPGWRDRLGAALNRLADRVSTTPNRPLPRPATAQSGVR